MTEPLTCRELVALVSDYLEGALTPEERLAFERHIAICPPCRGYLDELRRTIEVAGTLREDDLPADARGAMLAVFQDWKTHG